ncbi:hypothetical protein HDE_10863 [Halotydeus destructor]|nr:hypothetical protein HDE_10863 [Halotydeus destructor]
MTELFRRLSGSIYLCICILCFTYQVAKLNSQYFRYETFTRTLMDITRYTYAPDLHVCPATDQVFNFTAYNAKFNTSLGTFKTDDDVFKFQNTMTVAQLLEYSPLPADFVDKCIVRRPHSNAFSYLNSSECRDAFNMTKYYTLEYICYVVNLIPFQGDLKYDANRISYALNFPGLYYQLTLNEEWLKFMNYFKVLATQRTNGDRSVSGAVVVSRGLYKNTALYSLFYVSYYKIRYHRLAPPYDTKCRDYIAEGLKTASGCSHKCINKRSLRDLDRYWYASHAHIPIDKLPLSTYDFKNKTFGKVFEDIYLECQAACAQPECNRLWTLTLTRNERLEGGIKFNIVKSKEPSFFVQYDALLTLESYLIFFMSCIGSWFGLSVLSFSPARLADMKRKQEDRKHGGRLSYRTAIDARKDIKKLYKNLFQLRRDMQLTSVSPTRYMTPPGGFAPQFNSDRKQHRINFKEPHVHCL